MISLKSLSGAEELSWVGVTLCVVDEYASGDEEKDVILCITTVEGKERHLKKRNAKYRRRQKALHLENVKRNTNNHSGKSTNIVKT